MPGEIRQALQNTAGHTAKREIKAVDGNPDHVSPRGGCNLTPLEASTCTIRHEEPRPAAAYPVPECCIVTVSQGPAENKGQGILFRSSSPHGHLQSAVLRPKGSRLRLRRADEREMESSKQTCSHKTGRNAMNFETQRGARGAPTNLSTPSSKPRPTAYPVM